MTNISNKVAYVKAQPVTGKHTCHYPGCNLQVPPAMWGCKKHWFKLPANLKFKIWTTYNPGQEISKTPSKEYIEVAKEVQDWITKNAKTI